ncbi:secondary thiamine-phosphate synthase enzyme YjbQ [Alteromonas sp. 1_MG-2023]|uniref:secondary thiamine-phosphate synthase enzyme YjbQ n=1 Tax=Alteromonas sp. 1_MG-2023 TaxID=3062669 RepID=UPI0026E157D3|nr:secondary thiamine-phosphate synthase enzyme YjbQ [Alteromonas sp. 1_MG-2023]MDO6568536.1 secondary thiamine-phosphate synthase enzyme YjbQ [Alteromonas sp. 1_MG-2023]
MTNNSWYSENITLPEFPRGFHLVTEYIISALPMLQSIEVGLLHLWLKHTSASLTINENADPTVRSDMEAFFNYSVKENLPFFRHTYEGSDDMPAHLKSSLLGCQVSIPVEKGRLQLGTWQGIMLGEHRDFGGQRTIIATLQGLARSPI